MSLELGVGEFRFAKQVTRQFIYVSIVIVVAIIGWMGVMLSTAHAASGNDFVTTWKTDNPGTSNSSSIRVPTSGYGYNYDVDWNNDGVFDEFGITGDATHDYGTPGTYTIRIQGTFPRIFFGFAQGVGEAKKIINIDQWGTGAWDSLAFAFEWAENLKSTATDAPNLEGVTNTSGMFEGAKAFNGDLSAWDVSRVIYMGRMFDGATNFNSDLSSWNTSNVTDMYSMFQGAAAFKSDLSSWNTSNVTDMYSMFQGATVFNSNLLSWNVSKVTDMSWMFYKAAAFNSNLSAWDVSNVTDMRMMFEEAVAFRGDVASWDVSNVNSMSWMFCGATVFNGDLSAWDVSSVTDMSNMFYLAKDFNSNLSLWNTSNVTTMAGMFSEAVAFNGDVSPWDVSNVKNMSQMFYNATVFNGDISAWNITHVTDMFWMFLRTSFSSQYYDALLTSWAGQAVQPNVSFSAGSSVYCLSAAARTSLVENKGWAIDDGGRCADISVTSVSPATVAIDGADKVVTISGDGYMNGAVVKVGGRAVVVQSISSTRIEVVVPTADITEASTVDVTITNPNGLSYTQSGSFTYRFAVLEIYNLQPNAVTVDGSDKYIGISGYDISENAVIAVGGKVVAIDYYYRYETSGDAYFVVIVPTSGIAQTQTVDITATNPNGKTYTLPNAFTYHMPSPNTIASVGFTTFEGKKIMSATGLEFITLDNYDNVGNIANTRSLVSLNGIALPFCTDRTGSTKADYIDWGADPTLVSDDAPCYYLERYNDATSEWSRMFTQTRVELLLPADFDTTAPGTLSVNGSPEYAFNQPAPTVGDTALTGTPVMDKRPTFQGTTVPGSIVTVTVNSDPVVCTTTANAEGHWSCTLPSDLPAGNHTARIAVVTPDGQTVTFGPYAVSVAGTTITNNTPLAPNTGVKHLGVLAQMQFAWPFMIIGALTSLVIGGTIYAIRRKRTT